MHEQQWKRWSRQFPWLRGNHRSARCAWCLDFRCKSPQKSQLLQHERGKLHAAAGSTCPTAEQFISCIDERMKTNVSLRRSSAGSHKSIKLMWCLSEALKDITKQRIRSGLTSAITQDGQGSSLGIRLSTVSHERALVA